jgi:hypothetical protein
MPNMRAHFSCEAVQGLPRLLAEGARRAEAFDELAKIYGSFTEGFQTVDSSEARAVLNRI